MPVVSKQYANGTYYAAEFDETPFVVDILGVGAGGGGGSIVQALWPGGGGGGGAGGLFYRKFNLRQGNYTIVIGAGGVGGVHGVQAQIGGSGRGNGGCGGSVGIDVGRFGDGSLSVLVR